MKSSLLLVLALMAGTGSAAMAQGDDEPADLERWEECLRTPAILLPGRMGVTFPREGASAGEPAKSDLPFTGPVTMSTTGPPPAQESEEGSVGVDGDAAPPESKASKDARDLLSRAAARQGSVGFTGEDAVTRYRVTFGTVTVHSEKKDSIEVTGSSEAYAGPRYEGKPTTDRIRAEYKVDGKSTVIGHSGRVAWTVTGDGKTLRFTDADKNRKDIDEIKQRRRLLRMVRRVFFLGSLLSDDVEARAHSESEIDVPRFQSRKVSTKKVKVRSVDLKVPGGIPLRLHLSTATMDPVAIELLPRKAGDGHYLLTMEWYPSDPRAKMKGALPKGLRVPNWLELFEMPRKEGEEHLVRMQADVAKLELNPAELDDAYFLPPKD
ncbi:MAG: hypothetical protein ACYTG4_03530 [Planctomycetota bacterium]|jgi:hypothetical protein